MLKVLRSLFAGRRRETQRDTLAGWTLFLGGEAAELWVEALQARDAARLSNP